jgi:hypothetical protein
VNTGCADAHFSTCRQQHGNAAKSSQRQDNTSYNVYIKKRLQQNTFSAQLALQ